jgi:hypothetical protein
VLQTREVSRERTDFRDFFAEYYAPFVRAILGSRHKLFRDGTPRTPLRLVDSVTTTKGVVIATFRRAEAA